MTGDRISILIPTRNRPGILRRTLEELLARGFGGYPLLVYDDASDEPCEIAAAVAIWPGGRVIHGRERGGQAKGRNALLRKASTEYALLLDDDSWLEDRVVFEAAADEVETGGYGVGTFQYRALCDGAYSVGKDVPRARVTNFLGGACLFHIPQVMRVGGFFEELVYGYEEPELSMRLWLHGIGIEQFPEVVAAHNQFDTPDEARDYREYDYYYARNSILMSTMNLPLVLGLPHGLLRSVRRSLYQRRNVAAKVKGTVTGVVDTFRLGGMRKPCGIAKAWEWIKGSAS